MAYVHCRGKGIRTETKAEGRKSFKYLNHVMWFSPQTWITRKDSKWQTQPLPQTLWEIKVWHRCTLLDHRKQRKLCGIQWDFWIQVFKKMSYSHNATLELTSCLNDDMKLVQHQSRPPSLALPISICGQCLSAQYLQTVFPLRSVWCLLICFLPSYQHFLHMEYLNVLHRCSAVGAAQLHGDYAMVYTIWGLNPGRDKWFFSSP